MWGPSLRPAGTTGRRTQQAWPGLGRRVPRCWPLGFGALGFGALGFGALGFGPLGFWALAVMLAGAAGCGSSGGSWGLVGRSQYDSLQSQNRSLAERSRAQQTEIENLRLHAQRRRSTDSRRGRPGPAR